MRIFLYKFLFILILLGSKFFVLIISLKKVVYAGFYIYIFDFITHFQNTFINIKLLIIHYFSSEMIITVLLDILSNNNSKY